MERRTGEDLAEMYSDESWRAKYMQMVSLVTLLRYSIIPAGYKIPDRMNTAFDLTDYGTRIQHTLTTKHDVPAKEARLMCFLEIAHEEPMVDLDRARLDVMTEELSQQIIKGIVRYPFIYAGILYHRAADIFPDRRAQLNSAETLELLAGSPAGVFQAGRIVVGPLGALTANTSRWLPPDNRVPLQHCSDPSCRSIHSTALSTDYDAAINQHLPKMSKVLEDVHLLRGAWTEFTSLLAEVDDQSYDDLDMTGVPVALGDCFTDDELRLISRRMDISSDVDLENADRATMMQLMWMQRDAEVTRAVDACIRSGEIELGVNEIRRPQIAEIEVGSFGLRTEIGVHGVRLKPRGGEIPYLRLTRLVRHLYDAGNEADSAELLWQLRSIDGTSAEDRLEEYLRIETPTEVVRRLVLARRQNVERALADLRIDSSDIGLGEINPAENDEVLIERILWKLGFEPDLPASASSDFLTRHSEMRQVMRDSRVSAVMNVDRIREAGRALFISLEGLLEDSLAYAWWALTFDHVAAARRFTYRPSDAAGVWPALRKYIEGAPGEEKLRLSEPRTLYPLGQGFGCLARLLESFDSSPDDHLRDTRMIPKWVPHTELKDFRFRHTIPFLDLGNSSKTAILRGMTSLANELKSANVHGIRNGMSHFQRSSANLDDIDAAVAGAGAAVETLGRLGLIRTQYRLARTEVDTWGRAITVMRSGDGDEITFSRPSRVDGSGMPHLRTPQYVVRSAVFGAPNEVLRFRVGSDSAFSDMWANFPRPRALGRPRLGTTAESASEVARTSHGVLPQA